MSASSYTPESLLAALMSADPVLLSDLPETHGIYGLVDHEGEIRYIGVTAAEDEGFLRRINSRHATGSEGRSHKFAQAYNTGRMWRSRDGIDGQRDEDAKLARKLRSAFCREYCRAVFVSIPRDAFEGDYFDGLAALERPLQKIAPEGMRLWEKRNFEPVPEPTALVDALLAKLATGREALEALARQAALGIEVRAGRRMEAPKARRPSATETSVKPAPACAAKPDGLRKDASASTGQTPNAPLGDWYVMRPRKAQAFGRPAQGGFLVRAGSTAMARSPLVDRDEQHRDRLIRQGILVKDADPDLLRFAKDHLFNSPSQAGGIIKCGNCSGPGQWKHAVSGRSLRDMFR